MLTVKFMTDMFCSAGCLFDSEQMKKTSKREEQDLHFFKQNCAERVCSTKLNQIIR